MASDADTFYIKQDDEQPTLQTQLVDPNGNPVDLTGASVAFRLAEPRGGSELFQETATITDAANGIVEYRWGPGDTDSAGRYRAEFVVTWGNGDVETYPNVGYETVYITPSA